MRVSCFIADLIIIPETRQTYFELCLEFSRSIPTECPVQLNQTQQIDFYALLQQATIGPCNTQKPGCVCLLFLLSFYCIYIIHQFNLTVCLRTLFYFEFI